MAKRIAGVTEKLMEAAKQEFLKNGYERASLQTIAEKAGSSKGAIYIRYPDKESLYRSLVQPAIDGFCELLQSVLYQFNRLSGEEQTRQMLRRSNDEFPKVVDYLYDHFEEFKLLFTSGENNAYQEFIHRVVELDTGCTARYIEASGNDAISSGRLTLELNHLLSSAFYTGMFEVVIHNMPKEQAMKHIQKMRRFYTAGWQTIFSDDGGEDC
ncbi:TetR/AcrR family transcriptional regulator [Anaeromassilibacillus sp. An200]|uniref:TetR/AcrR family transcriptional regulator n=1 Tax=Anaeromassilibacillus sp. An200 TaxID=1965587 RepID=UPI000B367B35|nr:TetR/AcrR family transcriptional regulator [Anaeromassilibacillus sp. An200]OUP06837.1 TetR family transcriptional regulator [Anaeromassilibacillus sp. An200]